METKALLQFEGFRIVKTLIERKEGEMDKDIKIDINSSGIINESEGSFELKLDIHLEDENKVFISEVSALGLFTYSKGQEEKVLNNYFYTNAPAILFPYVRAYISSLTTLSGFSPLTLPTLNMAGIRDKLRDNTKTI